MSGRPINDRKVEFIALMERSEAACQVAGDARGALEARIARLVIAAAIDTIEEELAGGTEPAVVMQALARGFGIPLVAALICLSLPGKSEAAVDLIIPDLGDVVRAFAHTQDQRALEAQNEAKNQGKLFS